MITKDLGMVTAYAYAVSKGYTGTETEFAELMASYASVAQEAVDAALAAAQSAQAAESAKDTAQTTVDGAIAGIQAEGQTQVGVVQAEGQTQVGNVNTAGSTQVSAVQAKGTEVLNSIPADYSTLSGEVTGLKSAIDDIVSPVALTEVNKSSSIWQLYGNYYQGSAGDLNENASYTLYTFVAPNNFDWWFPADVTAMDCICAIYNGTPLTNNTFVSPRYRIDNNTYPTESNKASITAGQVLTIATYNQKPFTILTSGIKVGIQLNNGVIFPAERYSEISNNILPSIKVTVGTNEYIFEINGYTLPFKKKVDASTRANLWNFAGISKGATVIFGAGTDIIGVLQESGQSDFMGGVHGDETNTEMIILGDNETLTTSGEYSRIDIFMNSHLTRVSTGDNVIDRVVHICIENNSIVIDNTFICLVDNFNLSYAYNGGMWAWFKSAALKVYTSYGVFDYANGSGDWGMSNALSKATVILADGSHFELENIIGRNYDNYEGEIYTYPGDNPRQKLYFATDHNSTWQSGHRCYGRTVYRLIK